MPRLSKRYIHPDANKRSLALVEEVVKMSLGLGGWVLSGYASASSLENSPTTALSTTMSVLQEQLQHWSPLSTLIAAGIPSALYALQGTLTYTAYQNLDAVTYNGLTQLKVLSSAFCCYVILNKRQSVLQMESLGLLMLSSVVFQGSWKDWIRKQTNGNGNSRNLNNRRILLMGVLPCLTATLLSGLAGAFSQRSLQTQVGGQMHRDAYFYTVEISFLSAACLVISMVAEYWQRRKIVAGASAKEVDTCDTKNNSFFQHWTYATLLPITTRATAGLLTALVHRHLGSVVKGFALVLGLVFSALLQWLLEGVDLTAGQLVGTALVLFSSWLHFKG
jgi:UDP-sugar transporter A1/2/3